MPNSIVRRMTPYWGAAFVAALIATPTLAQRPVSRADLNGEWTGPIALDAGTQMLALVFRATDSTLAGTIYSDGAKFGEMENPSLSGNTVHFKLDRLDFTGVIEATTMNVALIVFNGSTRHLTLKKVPVAGGDSSSTPRKPPRSRS